MKNISAIIPTHNESKTIAKVINSVRDFVDEVIVVNSCSQDNTAQIAIDAGAIVIDTYELGKHVAIKSGIMNASGEILVFVDGDWENPDSKTAELLVSGLLSSPDIKIAKGYYDEANSFTENGRLTELCAKPLLKIFLSELANIKKPLSGEYAVRRKDLLDMEFAPGFAVDLGILIQCSKKGSVYQVKLNSKIHKHRKLSDFSLDAIVIATTIFKNCQIPYNEKILLENLYKEYTQKNIDLNPIPPIKS